MNTQKNYFLILAVILISVQFNFSQGILWGTTPNGADFGNIFSISTGSNGLSSNYQLKGYSGRLPQYGTPLKATNGKLYGMTSLGGLNSKGVLFEYDPQNNTYIKLLDFNGLANGSIPYGSLMQASNGKLYGMTSYGGTNNFGTLFEYNISTNILLKKADFIGVNNGNRPTGALTESSTGKLYGLTSLGGANNLGVLFEFDTVTAIITKKVDFSGTPNGSSPQGSMISATNGKMYGLTRSGGVNNQGILFEYDATLNNFVKKFDFLSANFGDSPFGSLFQASNGLLYGVTSGGGISNSGTIFSFDVTTSILLKKFDFNGTSNGSVPYGTFIEGSPGNLYCTTRQAGSFNLGVLFEYNIFSNIVTKKYDFNGNDGQYPQGGFAKANSGKLYALAYQGGAINDGVLFEYDYLANTYTNKANFNTSINGVWPTGQLMMASNGKLYSFGTDGGIFENGVLYEYDVNTGIYTKKYDFSNTTSGENPVGKLVETISGKLYGMTFGGGLNNKGVLFEYDYITNVYTKKLDFGGLNGEEPYNSLLKASNGKLYGMTYSGGLNGAGVIFEYDFNTNVYTKKIDLASAASGYNPRGSLIEPVVGKLYGLTYSGGNFGGGAIFEYDFTTNVYTKKGDFNVFTTGDRPWGSLAKAANGKLYGTCETHAVANGTLFEYDLTTSALIKKVDFNGFSNGDSPKGSLTAATNGKLYGTTIQGGVNNFGVLFEYLPGATSVTKKIDFNIINGKYPIYDQLLEICATPQNTGAISSSMSQFCAGSGSNISLVTPTINGATSYTWGLPAGSLILNGAGTNSLIVDFSSAAANVYSITFSGINGCGQGVPIITAITINATPTISCVSSNSLLCSSQAATLTASGALSYIWSPSGAGASIVISPTINTTYTTTGTDVNGCIGSSTVTQSVIVCTEINQFTINSNLFIIYPNPFKNIVKIICNETNQTLRVFNLLGALIYETYLNDLSTEIDLTNQNNGIYFIKVGSITKKIIKDSSIN